MGRRGRKRQQEVEARHRHLLQSGVGTVEVCRQPAIVTERSRLGDWEGDLVVGPMSRSAVAKLVDRRSRYPRLIHLPERHRADHLVTALEG